MIHHGVAADYSVMRLRRARAIDGRDDDESEITRAAVAGYARLSRAVGGRILTHAERGGGLICEKRAGRARPTLWRITADGTVLPDSPYSYEQRAFVTGAEVAGLAAVPSSTTAATVVPVQR